MENAAQPDDSSLVSVFRMAEGGIEGTELLTVQQLLESNGIATVLVGDSPLPNLGEEIRVASEDADRARQLIAEALSVGTEGAEEAELDREAELGTNDRDYYPVGRCAHLVDNSQVVSQILHEVAI